MRTVVAFAGKRGSGKSEASKALVDEMGFVEIKFADPLKNMLRAMYRTCGLDNETIDRKIEGDLKEEACPLLCGATPRRAMQTLGTEWRDNLNPVLDENDEPLSRPMWSEMFKARVRSGTAGDRVVCSDYRFPHEGRALDDLGGMKYRITRDTADAVSDEAAQHPSETLIDTVPTDVTIHNGGTIEDLRSAVLNDVHEGMRLAAVQADRVAAGGDYWSSDWHEGGIASDVVDKDYSKDMHMQQPVDLHQARADAEGISRSEAKRRNHADSYRGPDPHRDRSLDFKAAAHLADPE